MPEQTEGASPSILLALLPFLVLVALGLLAWRFRDRRATRVVVLLVIPALCTAVLVLDEVRQADYLAAATWAVVGGGATSWFVWFLRRQPDASHE